MSTAGIQKATGRVTTRNIVYVGMFAAVMAVLSQVSIPMPTNVPITLQTFAMALTGAVLGWKLGLASTVIYILLGAVGVPVFAGFSGGFSYIVGYSGGFIYGFIFLTVLCGLGISLKNKVLGVIPGLIGLEICHLFGTIQYAALAKQSFWPAFLLVSLPYQLKDVISVILAFMLGLFVRKQLFRANLIS